MSDELDYTFHAMGSDVRLLIGPPLAAASAPAQAQIAERERAFVLDFARRLSRFVPDSELTALNHDPRPEVPRVSAAPSGRDAQACGRLSAATGSWTRRLCASSSDPAMPESLDGAEPASLVEALEGAPPRRPARPNAAARWRRIVVDDAAGVIRRPSGVMIDTGGTGKGLCADAVAHRLGAYTRFVVDCGGDIAVGGVGAQLEPYEIEVEHPLTQTRIGTLARRAGRRRNVRAERPHLAGPRRSVRPPPARSKHRSLGLDRLDWCDRARPERARSRDAVEDGSAARRSRSARGALPSTAA